MITKFKNFLLNESPDNIYYNKRNLNYCTDGAYPFGYDDSNDDFLMTDFKCDTHDSLISISGNESGREHMYFTGRVWIKEKLISFWDYPENYTKLKKVLKDLEEEYNILFYDDEPPIKIDDNWNIEVIMDKNDKQIINKYKYWGSSEHNGDGRYINDSVIIKVGEYKGSSKRSAEELASKHLKVGNGGAEKGWGSRYYDDKLKPNMNVAKYKNDTTRYKFTESVNNKLTAKELFISIENTVNGIGYIQPWLNEGGDIDVVDDGWTLITLAANNNWCSMIVFLLSQGADINSTNYNGNTALMLNDDYRVTEILLRDGADPYIRNKQGKDFLEIMNSVLNVWKYDHLVTKIDDLYPEIIPKLIQDRKISKKTREFNL